MRHACVVHVSPPLSLEQPHQHQMLPPLPLLLPTAAAAVAPPPTQPQDYEEFTEARAWELLAAVSLDEADMQRLSEQLFGDSGEAVGTGLSFGGVGQTLVEEEGVEELPGAAKAAVRQEPKRLAAVCS